MKTLKEDVYTAWRWRWDEQDVGYETVVSIEHVQSFLRWPDLSYSSRSL